MIGGSYGFDSTLYNDTSRSGDGALELVEYQCGINPVPVQRLFCKVEENE